MSLLIDLENFLVRHASDKPITLAYSGGLDSSVLLHMLCQLSDNGFNQQIQAIHIHHGLSPNADDWVEHCRQICLKSDIIFDVAYADIDKTSKKSLEQLAREARYSLLDKLMQQDAILLTAQHQDDQAETLLLQLMRGAGPKGLSAMSESGHLQSGRQVLRPLLSVTRFELEKYAKAHQLEWIEDESNQDVRFDRNFLRNQVMPMLKSRWPNASTTISRSATLCDEQQSLIEIEALDRLNKARATKENNQLDLEELKQLTPEWFNQVVRLWFREWQIDLPSVSVMQQIYQQACFASDDAQVCIQLTEFQLRRYDNLLYLISDTDAKNFSSKNESINWDGEESLVLPHVVNRYSLEKSDDGFSKKPKEVITVKFGCLSEKFKPQSNRPSKLVKQWFKEWKVPPWERKSIPFFYCGTRLVQIGDRLNLLNKNVEETDSYTITCREL